MKCQRNVHDIPRNFLVVVNQNTVICEEHIQNILKNFQIKTHQDRTYISN